MIPFWMYVLWLLSIILRINEAAFAVTKWNERLQKFEPIPGLPSYEVEKQKRHIFSRQEETHNFNQKPLRITYFEENGFFRFYDNDAKVSGIMGDIWTILSELLNFKLVAMKSRKRTIGFTYPNGSSNGILEEIRSNRTDIIPKMEILPSRLSAVVFSEPLWINNYRLFTRGQWKRRQNWIFKQFSIKIWCLIPIFSIMFSLISFAIQRVYKYPGKQKLRGMSDLDHSFCALGTTWNEDSAPENFGSSANILRVTVSLFSWILSLFFNGLVIYTLAIESVHVPFDSFETLLNNTNIQILVANGSMSHVILSSPLTRLPIFRRIQRMKRFEVVKDDNTLHDMVCSNPDKYTFFATKEEILLLPKSNCKLIGVGETLRGTMLASGIGRGVKHKRSFDIGIQKLRESGLLNLIRKRYIPYHEKKIETKSGDELMIDMNDVFRINTILFYGFVASIIVCIVENIHFTLTKRRPR